MLIGRPSDGLSAADWGSGVAVSSSVLDAIVDRGVVGS